MISSKFSDFNCTSGISSSENIQSYTVAYKDLSNASITIHLVPFPKYIGVPTEFTVL